MTTIATNDHLTPLMHYLVVRPSLRSFDITDALHYP